MVDLHDLRGRAAKSGQLLLSFEEALELLTEVEVSRKLLEPEEADFLSSPAHVSLVTELMLCLSQGLANREQAELVATLITQEIAGAARMRVRTKPRCLC